MNTQAIIRCLDEFIEKNNTDELNPVDANNVLAKKGLLRDSDSRPGKPLRDLLRKGKLPHAFQPGGKGSGWVIPHSGKTRNQSDEILNLKSQKISKQKDTLEIDTNSLKVQLNEAREKYKPENIKYLLIAEAPPDSIERFFYYPSVSQHDHLFLGVSEALYPELKDRYLMSRRDKTLKETILKNFQNDGFYLLDLSELPLSLLNVPLKDQLPNLLLKLKHLVNNDTKIILIKANVFDIAYGSLNQIYTDQVVNKRLPFPGQGWQKEFQVKFSEALEIANS